MPITENIQYPKHEVFDTKCLLTMPISIGEFVCYFSKKTIFVALNFHENPNTLTLVLLETLGTYTYVYTY